MTKVKASWIFPLALALSCGADPAPADLDGLARWFWVNYEVAGDEEIADAIGKLHQAVGGAELDDPLEVGAAHLSPGDVEGVGMEGKGDLAFARGMLVADLVSCSLAKMEELSIALDQIAVYGGYDKYNRAYTSDVEAYKKREESFLTWTTDYTVSGFGSSYDAKVLGGSRFVPKSPLGLVFMMRAWLVEPAKFNNPDDFFKQDYQLNVFYERKPGEVVRVTALWREMRFAGFDTEGDILVNFTMDGMVRANDKAEEHCD